MAGVALIATEALAGWSTGFQCSLLEKKETEIIQGATDTSAYGASFCQSGQVGTLSRVASRGLEVAPPTILWRSIKAANATIPFFSLIACPATMAVKQGHYREAKAVFLAITQNRFPAITGRLPEQLTPKTTRFFNFFADNTGKIVKAGVITGAAVLPFFGCYVFAGSLLVPMLYREVDRHGWVPSKMSLLLERYMPAMATFGLLTTGGGFLQAMSALELASYSPRVNRAIHHRLDDWIYHKFQLQGPTLKEVDAPFVLPPDLSFEKILSILHSKKEDWEINPSACALPAVAGLNLPEDRSFEKYLTHFKSINWIERYSRVFAAFKDDDLFRKALAKKLNEEAKARPPEDPEKPTEIFTKESVYKNFASHIEALAKKAEKTSEQFLADLVTEQMSCLVAILQGKRAFQGTREDHAESTRRCALILSHLNSLNLEDKEDRVSFEGILLKLAVEAGDYCVRAIKRASGEILDEISYKGLLAESFDPVKDYEQKLRQAFEGLRSRIFQHYYQKFIEQIVKVTKEGIVNEQGKENIVSLDTHTTDSTAVAMAQDVHAMDIYRLFFALGFLPLTGAERNSFGFSQFIMWGVPTYPFREMRNYMYQTALDRSSEVFEEMGAASFTVYIGKMIGANPHLSVEQKEKILSFLSDWNDWKWTSEETMEKFYRLVFVKMGILRPKNITEDSEWTEVPEDSPMPEETLILSPESPPARGFFSDWNGWRWTPRQNMEELYHMVLEKAGLRPVKTLQDQQQPSSAPQETQDNPLSGWLYVDSPGIDLEAGKKVS